MVKQKKKENKRKLTLALALLAVVSAGAYGTYSKYTETFSVATGTDGDKAVVASWNVGETATQTKLFDTHNFVATGTQAGTQNELIAPGTSGEKIYTLSGQADSGKAKTQVKYAVTISDFAATVTNEVATDKLASALKYSASYKLDDASEFTKLAYAQNVSGADLASKLNGKKFTPDFTATGGGKVEIKISWKWDFTADDTSDLALGQAGATATESAKPAIAISFKAVAAQQNT